VCIYLPNSFVTFVDIFDGKGQSHKQTAHRFDQLNHVYVIVLFVIVVVRIFVDNIILENDL